MVRKGVLTAAAAAVLVYLNALDNPFVYDDHDTILRNPSLADLGKLRFVLGYSLFRPIVNASYALDHAVRSRQDLPSSGGIGWTHLLRQRAAAVESDHGRRRWRRRSGDCDDPMRLPRVEVKAGAALRELLSSPPLSATARAHASPRGSGA
jgi:hypothetical protein